MHGIDWAIVALYLAVFPANINMLVNDIQLGAAHEGVVRHTTAGQHDKETDCDSKTRSRQGATGCCHEHARLLRSGSSLFCLYDRAQR